MKYFCIGFDGNIYETTSTWDVVGKMSQTVERLPEVDYDFVGKLLSSSEKNVTSIVYIPERYTTQEMKLKKKTIYTFPMHLSLCYFPFHIVFAKTFLSFGNSQEIFKTPISLIPMTWTLIKFDYFLTAFVRNRRSKIKIFSRLVEGC